MALDLRLQQKMSQQLVMTPQLQQAIKLLQLSHLEMAEALREELEKNPVLEEQDHDDDHHQCMQLVDFAGDARDRRLQVHLVGGRCDRREKRQERSDENSLFYHACLVL